jgi:SNF2 family DNA or RNA helicase
LDISSLIIAKNGCEVKMGRVGVAGIEVKIFFGSCAGASQCDKRNKCNGNFSGDQHQAQTCLLAARCTGATTGFIVASDQALWQSTSASRRLLLEEFKKREGFGVIVLSPFVAGVGLTIVEANHVIHYGRWWNPAVDAQATDRAYRRGQEKPVRVYLPILHDPTGQISDSFDELLDRLMTRKEELARSTLAKEGFRAVTDTEENTGEEMIASLSR